MDEPLTDVELTTIREREQAATPGPWVRGTRWGGREGMVYPQGALINSIGETVTPEMRADLGDHATIFIAQVSNCPRFREDAEFIAHARNDIPRLLATIDALLAERG